MKLIGMDLTKVNGLHILAQKHKSHAMKNDLFKDFIIFFFFLFHFDYGWRHCMQAKALWIAICVNESLFSLFL